MPPATATTTGYVPFAQALSEAVKPAVALSASAALPSRKAVLVLHGMGAQKPYETLDQFARGLLRYFGVGTANQEMLLRQQKGNPNTGEKDWTQAYVRVRPHGSDDEVIDVYEYYWAPVITDKVSALQSLRFLIFTGLTPFQYLRDNLEVIVRADTASTARHRAGWIVHSLLREIFRMLFIFIPLIAAAATLYGLIAHPVLHLFEPGAQHKGLAVFVTTPIPNHTLRWQLAVLVAQALRWLLLGMAINFIVQECISLWQRAHHKAGTTLSPAERNWHAVLLAIVFAFAAFMYATPAFVCWLTPAARQLFTHFCQLSLRQRSGVVAVALTLVTAAVTLSSKIVRIAWQRGFAYVKTHLRISAALALVALAVIAWLAWKGDSLLRFEFVKYLLLPTFLHWKNILAYAVLALLVYAASKFLTTAIGCLVVYLGADALSRNYAARSQILHECTEAVLRLIDNKGEDGKPDPRFDYHKVFVAAHSLGSVVAYDALNQIIIRREARDPLLQLLTLTKLAGLLTFGCPLNKVFYFFRTRTTLKTTVLSQILYALHPFRLRSGLPPEANPAISLPHPFPTTNPFGEFIWYNAYSPFDLISGRMLFYTADADVPVEHGVTPWTAHLSYWDNNDLYTLFGQML